MGHSRALKSKIDQLSKEDQDRLVRMGWEDRATFENIEKQFLDLNALVRLWMASPKVGSSHFVSTKVFHFFCKS